VAQPLLCANLDGNTPNVGTPRGSLASLDGAKTPTGLSVPLQSHSPAAQASPPGLHKPVKPERPSTNGPFTYPTNVSQMFSLQGFKSYYFRVRLE
jgi:hypothetical protein